VFERLDRMADELRRDRSRQKLAQAVTLYHLLVEGTLAQPGQHLIEEHLEARDVLPGFRAGMANVSHDEQRHIAFGVKLVADLVAEEPECRDAIAELIREVLPYSTAVYVPPGWDERYPAAMGVTLEEQHAAGNRAFEQKLRAAGVALETLPGPALVPLDLTPEERAREALVMLRAGILGEKDGPPSTDPDAVGAFFAAVARAADVREAPDGGLTVQWEFDDAGRWQVHVDRRSAVASPGATRRADVRISGRFEEWVDVATGRKPALRALASRRLRVSGTPLALWRLGRVFPVAR
jgi:putative sterol carrier protein